MSAYTQLARLIPVLDSAVDPTLLAKRVIQANELIIEVIEIEQDYRARKHFFGALPASPFTVAGMSNYMLSAQKGWCSRLLATADEVLNNEYATPVDYAMAVSILRNSIDALKEEAAKFTTPPINSVFVRFLYFMLFKVKGWRFRRAHRIALEATLAQRLNQDTSKVLLMPDGFEEGEQTSGMLMGPDNAVPAGAIVIPSEDKNVDEIAHIRKQFNIEVKEQN